MPFAAFRALHKGVFPRQNFEELLNQLKGKCTVQVNETTAEVTFRGPSLEPSHAAAALEGPYKATTRRAPSQARGREAKHRA